MCLITNPEKFNVSPIGTSNRPCPNMIRSSLMLFLIVIAHCTAIFAQKEPTRIVVPGVRSEVTVRRDSRWVPYIEAKNSDDLYFAQGYITASDRLWQMDLMRRLGRGQTAEIFGKVSLEEDKRWRRFNFSYIAEENLRRLLPENQRVLENYARGVNAYIEALNEQDLPAEFRILQYRPAQWRPSDTIIIGKLISDALSTTWRHDLLRASLQGLAKDKLVDLTDLTSPNDVILFGTDSKKAVSSVQREAGHEVSDSILAAAEYDENIRRRSLERAGLYAEELAASNNWVISGKRTASGKPILANDPHLAPTAPGIWYMTHLATPDMRVAGVTFPGVPGITLGHNEHIAWGATNVGPDVQDLYVETFNAEGKYKTPAGWENPVIRKEIIKVRTNPLKADVEPVEFEVVETRHGPVILDEGGKRYALRWTALDSKNSQFEAFYLLARARNWNDFKNALRNYDGVTQNFVYADVKGNIGWYAAGGIPIRRVGNGALPYDGATNDGDWIGYIPFDELPNLYDPPAGLIVTANQRIVGTSYKYPQMSRDAAAPWRARRIHDQLMSKQKVTIEDVSEIQRDPYNIPATELANEIVRRKAASDETLNVLKAWDGRMTADSQAAVLANEIRGCMGNKIAESNKSVPSYVIRERILDRAIREDLVRWLPAETKSYDELMAACDQSVRADLARSSVYGPDPTGWLWGKSWRSRFSHPLASVPLIGGRFITPNVPIDGSGQSPNVGSAVSMRHITSPGLWDMTRLVIPLGQSGDAESPHFRDQFEAWSGGKPMVFPFTRAAVESTAQVNTIFSPK